MIPAHALYNFAVWSLQVLLITSIGALLPFAFRIHHPRSELVYYRLLLLAALLLPWIQPIQHQVVLVGSVQPASTIPAAASTRAASAPGFTEDSWSAFAIGVLAAGVLARLAWLAGGLWQLRRLRNCSTPLNPWPRAVRNAGAITKTGARFCLSDSVKGPVTFGFLDPVILLPRSFLEMPEDAQNSIACHELLHVRRNDWLVTLAEELVASLLWFQPAVWWLVAQSQLAREQLVDAAVVSLAASRESYVQTLFSLADAKWEADVGVASLFLRRRHLIHRVHSLLTEVSMSRTKLLSSYCSIALILGLGGALMFGALPLTGAAEIRQAAVAEPTPQSSPGYVVNRSPISYPPDALQKRIEGQVVIELTFNSQGDIVDSRVLSGPEPLRQAGLQTALQGKYPIDVARTLQVVIDFKLPAPGQRATFPLPPGAGARGAARGGPRGGGPAPADPAAVLTADPAVKVRVGAGVAANNLITRVPPAYPPLAQAARIQGTVVLEAEISKEGKVENLRVVTGHPLLIQEAIDAVKQWVYRPVMLNGQPVDIVTTISVNIPYIP